jgi:intraflagellar transport protein 122
MEHLIWLPHADWLSANDRFDEAQEAYKKAGRPDLSLRIIEFLTYNAVIERRFSDAAQYYWMLSAESLGLVKNMNEGATPDDKKFNESHQEYMKLAEIYQAYHLIH